MHGKLSQILDAPVEIVAPRLLGCYLEREIDGRKLIGKIVEVEAYNQTDEASHSYRGLTPRTAVMFGPAGFLYVYFSYGMHYCMNVVVGAEGYGAAVLIRAIEPLVGEDIMSANRHGLVGPLMTNGPAKTTQALAISRDFNGHNLAKSPLKLIIKPPLSGEDVVISPRVGISRAIDKLWRFSVAGNKFVSKARGQ